MDKLPEQNNPNGCAVFASPATTRTVCSYIRNGCDTDPMCGCLAEEIVVHSCLCREILIRESMTRRSFSQTPLLSPRMHRGLNSLSPAFLTAACNACSIGFCVGLADDSCIGRRNGLRPSRMGFLSCSVVPWVCLFNTYSRVFSPLVVVLIYLL